MANCLTGLCGLAAKNIKGAIDDPVLVPFAKVTVTGDLSRNIEAFFPAFASLFKGVGDTTFTAGNQSGPAVIKSLQVGTSNGAGCEIEIIDQEGGNFKKIFEKISRGGAGSDNAIKLKWGWLSGKCGEAQPSSCSGSASSIMEDPKPGVCSPELSLMLKTIAISYNTGGTVKYVLSCIDMVQNLYDNKSKAFIGTDKDPVTLKEAIKQLLDGRKIIVDFKKFDSVTSSGDIKFDTTDSPMSATEGPKQRWETKNKPVLEIIQEWLRPLKTDDGKGFAMVYDPTSPIPKITILSHIGTVCAEKFSADKFNIGTYVVNGGSCSPVISFTPVINYSGGAAYMTGGTAGGAHSPVIDATGPCPEDKSLFANLYNKAIIKVGHSLEVAIGRWEMLTRMAKAPFYSYQNTALNLIANNAFTSLPEADLKIQGNPNLSNPVLLKGKFVTLVVINPYQVESGCKWSSQKCNDVLSRSNWQIMGVFHDLRDGSYTTTLKLKLAGPGGEIPATEPLGGKE